MVSSLLIIGGSGFFGKSILDAYHRGNLEKWDIQKIIVMSRNAEKLITSNPELIDKKVTLVNSDISTCENIPDADYILHLAASSNALDYSINPEKEKLNIIYGTSNFCRLIKKRNNKNLKILYVSSGAVYGREKIGLKPIKENDEFLQTCKIDENKKYYTEAKRNSEIEILELSNLGFNVSIARCFAFIGKYLPRDRHFAVGNFIQQGMNGGPIIVKAEGLVYRSYMHTDDLVFWLMEIMTKSTQKNSIYNVGSDETIEIGELAKKVSNIFNVELVYLNMRTKNFDFYVPSIEKAKKELNLFLSINLNDAIINQCKRNE